MQNNKEFRKISKREAQAAFKDIKVSEEDILQDVMEIPLLKRKIAMRVMVDTNVIISAILNKYLYKIFLS